MTGRFDAFHALEEEKQSRIIRAALTEFGTKGFDKASTNNIAQTAQIGKGMLFYYFGSKEELFDFLCEYTIEFGRNNYIKMFTTDSTDFLQRYRDMSERKRQTTAESPEVVLFFESFFKEEQSEHFVKFNSEIEEIRNTVYNRMYEGIDYSLFREDLDGTDVVKYLQWLFNGYEEEVTQRFLHDDFDADDQQSLDSEWERYYAFIDDLYRVFYRKDKEER